MVDDSKSIQDKQKVWTSSYAKLVKSPLGSSGAKKSVASSSGKKLDK